MRISKLITGAAVAVASFGIAAPAMSAELVLNTKNHTTKSGQGRIYSDGDTQARVSAWSIVNGTVESARLGIFNQGLGVSNSVRGDSHTVDNGGSLDFLLFQFDHLVTLTDAQFRTGFHNTHDTDATIGFANSLIDFASQPPLAGLNLSDLQSIGNLFASNAANGNSIRNVNPNGFVGNTWLIGASFANPDHNRDGFKLKSLGFEKVVPTAPVPEPATWALMLLGFAAVGGAMRSKSKTKTTLTYA